MKIRRSMLIVDDSRIDRAILANIFKDEYAVVQASSGRMALSVLEEQPIDLVVLDIQMEDIDGFEVIRRMRANKRLCHIPVVVTTSELGHERLALSEGADDFVAKPLDPLVVKKRVDNIVTKYMLERERLEDALEDKEIELQSLADSVPGGICVVSFTSATHDDLSLDYFNDSFCQIFGVSRDGVEASYQHGLLDLIYEPDRALLVSRFLAAKPGVPINAGVRINFGGRESSHWVRISAVRFREKDAKVVFRCVIIDVTEAKINELLATERAEALRRLAERDVLTGLYNRSTFFDLVVKRLSARTEHDLPLLLVQFDVDRFKVLNELFGTARGNDVLVAIGRALTSVLGTDGIYARMGSDLFGFCIPHDPALLGEVITAVAEHCARTCPSYSIRLCYGGYVVDDLSLTVDVMCDRANLARSSIKGVYGETFAYYTEAMHQAMLREQRLLDDGERALASEQFAVFYQPIFDLNTSRLVSAEALVRWHMPDGGFVSPADFVPVFENSGFIVRLDRYVRRKVSGFIGALNAQGVACPPVSVNFSRLDLNDPALVDGIEQMLAKDGVSKDQFRIEVTESAFAEDDNQMSRIISELRARGYTLLMDDFGSGLSSLGMLRNIPVDVLKLDMRFLDDGSEGERGRKVLASIIPLAAALDLHVIAEGVETEQQVEFLRSIGCDYAQGFYYARPMPEDEFLALVRRASADAR